MRRGEVPKLQLHIRKYSCILPPLFILLEIVILLLEAKATDDGWVCEAQ